MVGTGEYVDPTVALQATYSDPRVVEAVKDPEGPGEALGSPSKSVTICRNYSSA
jgi:hypothetical protein